MNSEVIVQPGENEIATKLSELDRDGVKVFRRSELADLLAVNNPRKLHSLLQRLLKEAVLERVARGIYLNRLARSSRGYLIEEIACAIRRRHFNYVSLESILSEFGLISQIMVSRITIMTTGASGTFKTPYGIIEFTHTGRSVDALCSRTVRMNGRPLPIATRSAGIADLRRVGRNVNMLDLEEI